MIIKEKKQLKYDFEKNWKPKLRIKANGKKENE